jgi:hypothetical protein
VYNLTTVGQGLGQAKSSAILAWGLGSWNDIWEDITHPKKVFLRFLSRFPTIEALGRAAKVIFTAKVKTVDESLVGIPKVVFTPKVKTIDESLVGIPKVVFTAKVKTVDESVVGTPKVVFTPEYTTATDAGKSAKVIFTPKCGEIDITEYP